MNRDTNTVIEGLDRLDMSREDMEPAHEPAFKTSEEPESGTGPEMHTRHDQHDRMHVNLSQEEYTPDEIARMLGTSLEVVMHAIWNGDLRARRKGRKVICIPHAYLTEWLIARCRGV